MIFSSPKKRAENEGKAMNIRLYKGTSDSFGLGISFCNWDKSLTINFMRWYFGAEIYKVQKPQDEFSLDEQW